ncbi:MAG: rhamnulokinase [Treponema sp.]|nr:rhamnulokinase [Treponema sp.]MCL2181595.1 rhamnulokinase [Treponema sp.]
MSYHLAVDIGASSGRCILGRLVDGLFCINEFHRFPNQLVERGGHLCWDIDRIFSEILAGLVKCRGLDAPLSSVGIDTWAVDFVLLDENCALLGDTVSYRDKRTEGCDEDVYAIIPEAELYRRTGIQKQLFNTIFQLRAIQRDSPVLLERAAHFLMLPDYLHYKLCGVMSNEYTNATSTGLVNAQKRSWDLEIIEKLGFPARIFKPLIKPAVKLGGFTAEVREAAGFNCDVIIPVTHDTPSAVMAVPSSDAVYISSGTWSLIGIECDSPNCGEDARKNNFTNEGGFDKFCFRKNIMGLWLFQEVIRESGGDLSFESCEYADIESIIDVNSNRFFSPHSMTAEIKNACAETGQKAPKTPAETVKVIFKSLAHCYAKSTSEIETLTGKTFNVIHIVGGGTKIDYLNRLVKEASGKKVRVNPVEASAIGNISAQMIAYGEFKDLKEARECISKSFAVKEY